MNDVNISGCKLSADIVPYMYGEMSAVDSSAFESHLLECGACTDEFADVSNARFEIYDWKKKEFDPLETPVFEIPFNAVTVAAGFSWMEKLKTAFTHSWAVPGVAFAGLAIISLFTGVFYFSGQSGSEISQGNSNSRPTVASSPLRQPEIPAPIANGEPAVVKAEPSPATVGSTPRKRNSGNAKPVVIPRPVEARTITRPNRSTPTLNEFADDEDTSLRLAQLFEDIDTRD